jgi:toxin ParE1/3/4
MAHRLSKEAEHDLDDIAYYVAKASGSLTIAERLISSLTARFYILANHPRIGRQREDLLPGARSFPVGSYIIVYTIDDADVRILRVIHGGRNIAALFGR